MLANCDKSLYELMGRTPAIEAVIKSVNQVAATDFTVLIQGETGTGKELIANAIHEQSRRHDKPFIPVDCGAIPETLIESELFGHEKGAFTGAQCKKDGCFVIANHGTLFLDEISNLSLTAQGKLLRVLEERKIHPVGCGRNIDVDVRVIAASNLNLHKEAAENRFRLDLYHRLNEFSISLPSLRDRKGDILFLARRFIEEISIELNRRDGPRLSDKAVECLMNYQWTGNVRELRNIIRRALLIADGPLIGPECLCIETTYFLVKDCSEDVDLALKDISQKAAYAAEKLAIQKALQTSGGNKSKAAQLLKIGYKTLYNKIKAYGL